MQWHATERPLGLPWAAWDVDRALKLAACAAGADDRDGVLRLLTRGTLNQFLELLVECPSCGGAGVIAVSAAITVTKPYGQSAETYSPDQPMPCPTCEGSTFDPDFTRWVCQVDDYRACSAHQQGDGHAACGYRVSLPLQVKIDTVRAEDATVDQPLGPPPHQRSHRVPPACRTPAFCW